MNDPTTAVDDLELEARLRDLGAHLALDVDRVGFESDQRGAADGRRWLVAAAVILVVCAAVLAVPSSRDVVARWIGLDRVTVDVDPSATIPPIGVDDVERAPDTSVYEIDGRSIAVTRIGDRFDDLMIDKTVGSSDQVREVAVADQPGLWFPAPHTVIYRTAGGEFVSARVAGATLLVQTDGGIVRIEGFDALADAVDFAGRF